MRTVPPTGVSLALRLHALDRWPTIVSHPRVWKLLRFAEPFDYRWNGKPLPPRAAGLYNRLAGLEHAPMVERLRSQRYRRIAAAQLVGDLKIEHCNVGPGGRMSNSAHAAVAVDAHLNGWPATALGWGIGRDPVRVMKLVMSLDGAGLPAQVASPALLDRLVASWGPGAKGVVSLRDPAHAFHRVFTVVNVDGTARYFDYSRAAEATLDGRIQKALDPAQRAQEALAAVDVRSPFASIQVWRTRNIAAASPLPADLLHPAGDSSVQRVTQALAAHVPSDVPPPVLAAAAQHLLDQGDMAYAHQFLQQLRDGACTFVPSQLEALAKGTTPSPIALTSIDQALVEFARAGAFSIQGSVLEITLPDTSPYRDLADLFPSRTIRRGDIDGLAPETFEVVLDANALNRLDIAAPQYRSPASVQLQPADVPATAAAPRRTSWVEVNRVASPGTRATNCWNCAASVSEWLRTRSPSTGLPVYQDAPYRPQIADYLVTMGANGPSTYVDTLDEAAAVARSWGAGRQGLVVCSLTKDSTHIFNVVFDGSEVRFLDGHMGRDGRYNFDTDWMRIGVVEIGDYRA